MKKNARIYTKKSKKGKDYLYVDVEHPSKDGECFTFALSPKFLNKKQFAYLMRLVGGNNEKK